LSVVADMLEPGGAPAVVDVAVVDVPDGLPRSPPGRIAPPSFSDTRWPRRSPSRFRRPDLARSLVLAWPAFPPGPAARPRRWSRSSPGV